jgi:hypothetical protein
MARSRGLGDVYKRQAITRKKLNGGFIYKFHWSPHN